MNKRGIYFSILGAVLMGTGIYFQSMVLGGIGLYFLSRYLFMSFPDFWRKEWFYLVPGMVGASVAVMGLFSILRDFVLALHSGNIVSRPLTEIIIFAGLLVLVETGFLIFPVAAPKDMSRIARFQKVLYAVADRLAYLAPLAFGIGGFFFSQISFAGIAAFSVILFLHAGISEVLRCASVVNKYLSRFSVFSS